MRKLVIIVLLTFLLQNLLISANEKTMISQFSFDRPNQAIKWNATNIFEQTEWFHTRYDIRNTGCSPAINGSDVSSLNSNGILYVGGNGPNNYTKIQDAIDDANPGDTVFVYDDSSPYYENIKIGKSIQLVGENKNTTIIDASGGEYGIFIYANGVTVKGFTIRNAKRSFSHLATGIYITSKDNVITENIIKNNDGEGIYLSSSSYNLIFGNVVIGNYGVGIWLDEGWYNKIANNTVSNNVHGIVLLGSNSNIVSENTISSNMFAGIDIGGSLYNAIINNTLIENGISVYGHSPKYCDTNVIENNTANGKPIYYYRNKNGGSIPKDAAEVIMVNCRNIKVENLTLSNVSDGIVIGFSSEITISNCTITSNKRCGIYEFYSSQNTFIRNNISCNLGGIQLDTSSHNIVLNNALSNNNCGIMFATACSNNLVSSNFIYNNVVGAMIGPLQVRSLGNRLTGKSLLSLHNLSLPLPLTSYRCRWNIISSNNIIGNRKLGVYIGYSDVNIIRYNNFIDNGEHAYFRQSFCNLWWKNYWDDWNSFLPRPIHGEIKIGWMKKWNNWINFDWHPVTEPYKLY